MITCSSSIHASCASHSAIVTPPRVPASLLRRASAIEAWSRTSPPRNEGPRLLDQRLPSSCRTRGDRDPLLHRTPLPCIEPPTNTRVDEIVDTVLRQLHHELTPDEH